MARIAKSAARQSHQEVKFSDEFKSALIEMIKSCLLQDEEQLVEKLQGNDAVKMRKQLAGKLAQDIIESIDAEATDASDYDDVIEEAIADWKNTDEEWKQIQSGMKHS